MSVRYAFTFWQLLLIEMDSFVIFHPLFLGMKKNARKPRNRGNRKEVKKSSEASPAPSSARSLSQIKFLNQHWWKKYLAKRDDMSIDEEKAALIYEAMRRHPDVQQAWLDGKSSIGANGWQPFVGDVLIHMRQSWKDLSIITKKSLTLQISFPWFVPPSGYSTFPHKSSPGRCREVSMRALRLPESDDPSAAVSFVQYARKFADAGFVILAVDNKTKQSVRYAGQAIERLPRTFRKADQITLTTVHLPPDITNEELAALKAKQKAGQFPHEEISKMWSNHDERKRGKEAEEVKRKLDAGISLKAINSSNLSAQLTNGQMGGDWHRMMTNSTAVTSKRKRGKMLVESQKFDFARICRELEQLDKREISGSDFVSRMRLD